MTQATQTNRSLEKIRTSVRDSAVAVAELVAERIAQAIETRNAEGRPAVLGLATGHTPIGVYRALIRRHREEGLDFSRVVTFNLDEYYPVLADSLQSYDRWIWSNFLSHVNIPRAAVHIPDGSVPIDQVEAHCREYEEQIRQAGGIDIQILGIGRTGHIGFNEPGSSAESRTRLITLDETTRKDAAADFFGELNVPQHAITMGVGAILEARTVILMAFGEDKAPILRQTIEGPITDAIPATFLQQHADATVYLDLAAASDLTRVRTPWLVERVAWDQRLEKRAVVWLSQTCERSVLKLNDTDYRSNGLASLLGERGPVGELNGRVHAQLTSVILEDRQFPRGLRLLVFSPHPDDDAVSMGGTIRKLIRAGNELHIAYMTSGNVAVFDHDVVKLAELVAAFNARFDLSTPETAAIHERLKAMLNGKTPGQVDEPDVLAVKTLIRWAEARAACRDMGVPDANIHFLDLPFYQTGQVEKKPIGQEDIDRCHKLIERLRPQWVFLAGEMSDPHGTHRMCAEAIYAALARCQGDLRPAEVWAYRGGWQAWEPRQIDMAVPLSFADLQAKIFAIFKHQSQKDKALFPGPYDEREFWQRAESRNRGTADAFNALGLPEFYAMEAFVRIRLPDQNPRRTPPSQRPPVRRPSLT